VMKSILIAMGMIFIASCSSTDRVDSIKVFDYQKIATILDEPKGTSMNVTYIPILSSYNISYALLEKNGYSMSRDGQINCLQRKVIYFSGIDLSSEQKTQLVEYLCQT
jgi:hypothetical protein